MSDIVLEIEPVSAIPTWETKPHGVVSLLDMLKFWADFFVKALWEVNELEAKWHRNDGPIPFPSSVGASLSALQLQCLEHGLNNTAQKCGRLMDESHRGPMTFRDAVTGLKEVRERLEDEIGNELFLHLSPQEAKWYSKPDDGWSAIMSRFPRMRHDIEESSKCYGLGRYAASLFHVLLVAEFGIIQVSKLFDVAGDKPGWGSLQRLDKILERKYSDRTPLEQKHSKFLQDLLPMARSIKDSWRHKISHVGNKLEWMDTDFSSEVAEEIISATRGFMRRLAADLPRPAGGVS